MSSNNRTIVLKAEAIQGNEPEGETTIAPYHQFYAIPIGTVLIVMGLVTFVYIMGCVAYRCYMLCRLPPMMNQTLQSATSPLIQRIGRAREPKEETKEKK